MDDERVAAIRARLEAVPEWYVGSASTSIADIRALLAALDASQAELAARASELAAAQVERPGEKRRRITWNELTFDADVIHLAMLDEIALLRTQRDIARATSDARENEIKRLLAREQQPHLNEM